MIGIMPSEFWTMTPWELRVCVESFQRKQKMDHDSAAFHMWHGAVLTRWGGNKPFPDLESFMSVDRKRVRGIDEAAIMAKFKMYQTKRDMKANK